MALYTGIEMYKKIKGVEDWLLPHVNFYQEYVNDLAFHDSKGGYPHIEYIMTDLNMDWDDDYDNSDEAYYSLHVDYMKHIEKIEYIIQQIDKHDLKNKIENKEVCFITRNYPLAYALGDLFNFPKFYHRQLVDADELLEKLQTVNIEMHEKVRRAFESSLPIIKEHKDEWVFEVHVS